MDENKETLVGVSVTIKKELRAVMTDLDGRFSISAKSTDVIEITYLGYKPQLIAVKDVKGELTIFLEPNEKLLDEVVVVGYGVQKKESVTGAITTVSSKDLIKSPVTNVSNALSGRLSGVTVVQRSGEPGRDQSDIRIRGINTLSESGSTPLIVIDGVERASMDGIDMNEIESINVLKDASATAVFGIRGANGVVILTTKVGTESKPKVSLSMNVGWQTPTTLPKFLDAYEFALLKNEGILNDDPNATPQYTPEMLDKFRYGSDPVFYPVENLYSRFFKDSAMRQQYNINVNGGTKVTRYFVSLGYLKQDGIYNTKPLDVLDVGYDPNPVYNRYNVRANFDFNFTKNLSASIKLGGQFVDSNYPNRTTENLFSSILNSPPMIGYGVHNGKLIDNYIDDPLSFIAGRGLSNESVLLATGYSSQIENTLNLNISAKYRFDDLVKGLSARVIYAYDHYYKRSAVRNRQIDTYSALKDNDGNTVLVKNKDEGGFSTFTESKGTYRIDYLEAAIEYDRTFDVHKVTALLLYNQRKRRAPGLLYNVPEGLQGVVGRVTYAYDNRYLGEFNLGYNGSENFHKDRRFGTFPAFSLGWILTEEKFFPKNEFLNWLKFRGSFGIVGNDQIGSSRFLYLPTAYSYGANVYQFGSEGIDRENYASAVEGKIGNPFVTWEKSKKFNIGADIHLLNSELRFVFDYFTEKRSNILINRGTIPDIFGATDVPPVNLGRIENKGFEIEGVWSKKINDFEFNIAGNISYAKNKILFKDEPTAQYYWMMQTGFSVGQLKGYRSDGLYNYTSEVMNRPYYSFYANKVQKGDIKYIDIDGDGIIDQNDMVPMGYSSYPEITYGMNFGVNWKRFDISLLFQGASNTSIQQRVMTAWAFNLGANMTLSEHLNRWSQERFDSGQLITMPRLSSNGSESPNSQDSDFWLQKANYLRLKNAEIGYTINPKILAKAGISSLRLYVNGNNLLTFTNLKNADPENPTRNTGGIYPQMKVFNVGVNLNF